MFGVLELFFYQLFIRIPKHDLEIEYLSLSIQKDVNYKLKVKGKK